MRQPAVESPKANFIRGLDVAVKTGEAVKRAKAAGISVSPNYVRVIRAAMAGKPPAKGSKKQATGRPPSASGPTPAAAPATGSKRAFVLSYPPTTPVPEILAAAAAKGISLDKGYVYWVRSDAARGGRVRGPKKRATVGQTTRATAGAETAAAGKGASSLPLPSSLHRPRQSGAEAERLILDTALRVLGIERAIALLEAARGRLGRLLDD